jgi:hypothetical protein
MDYDGYRRWLHFMDRHLERSAIYLIVGPHLLTIALALGNSKGKFYSDDQSGALLKRRIHITKPTLLR